MFKAREICKFTEGSDSFVHLSTQVIESVRERD